MLDVQEEEVASETTVLPSECLEEAKKTAVPMNGT